MEAVSGCAQTSPPPNFSFVSLPPIGDINVMSVLALPLHGFHVASNARFTRVNGSEVVEQYGDPLAEHAALQNAAGIIDLSCRSRLCLTGADRVRFLNGQVTNNLKDLRVGQGCYAALVTAKARLETDLNIHVLQNELLLDFEPGLTEKISQRLEKYVIADDVQVVDVAPHYGLLSIQGPRSAVLIQRLGLTLEIPADPFRFAAVNDPAIGEVYLMNQPRFGQPGFDLFVPTPALAALMEKLASAAGDAGGRLCGWQACEMARIEAGIPRFGQDMDETNLAPEAGLESRAISYSKGCYIGQEVISRIRTYGQVAKALRGLRLADDLKQLPVKGDKLFHNGKECGYITSTLASPTLRANIALGYVRKEANEIGSDLTLQTAEGASPAKIVPFPFQS
jgi:folate-binding protein YgfZ